MVDMDVTGNNSPTISVIMGIYNCAETLPESIESILNQTFTDWELIMCDDGSSDDTYHVAERYASVYQNKIVLLKNEKNRGLNYTLNKCLEAAKGAYIARMDGDDRCSADRLEIELNTLKQEPEIAIVSSDMQFFDETGIWGNISHPTYPVNRDFLFGSPFCHAPCLVKREAYLAVGGYSDEKKLLRVEDYHLWIKMYQAGYRGKNIHIPLYQMRDDRNAYSRRKFRYRVNEAYVKMVAVKKLKLPVTGYIYALRPILVGLLPPVVYDILHKRKLKV
ncbi:MAG: glycosyltransferase [Lachnospiraceae bacterium]|nr:glycosyltransferase [Lachnospiraceae bacterium]